MLMRERSLLTCCSIRTSHWSHQDKNSATSCVACIYRLFFLLIMRTLQELFDDYKSKLADRTFLITLDNGDSFTVQFKTYNFPHLIGLSHCAEGRLKKQFSGESANIMIENKTLTWERLQMINKKMFDRFVIGKAEGFELFLQLFPNKPSLLLGIVFDSNRVVNLVDRNLEKTKLIIQDKTNPNITYIFMFGEEQNNDSDILYPLSIRKETSTIDYLDLQEKYQIVDIKEI